MKRSIFLLVIGVISFSLFLTCSNETGVVEALLNTDEHFLNGTMPEHEVTINVGSVQFAWDHTNHNPEEHIYTLMLDTVNPPTVLYSETTSNHYLEAVNLEPGNEYFWQVLCSDSCESDVYSFSVEEQNHSEMIGGLKQAVYLIGVLYENELYGIGTGFAITEREIMTNAHVVNALRDIIRSYGSEDFTLVALKDGYATNSDYCFRLDSSRVHPHYDFVDVFTYDFGVLTIAEGVLESHLEFASVEQMNSLAVGDDVFTLGFPGETNDLDFTVAISTYKNGTISALRPLEGSGEHFGNSVIQHNCNTTAGTSGSPLFNKEGKVIAIHNSGEYEFVYSYDQTGTNLVRIPVGSLNYGIRADLRSDLNETEMVSFENIVEDSVWYTFINSTWSDIEIDFVDLFSEFIGYQDTLQFWDYRGFAGISDIEATTLFDNHNYTWKDTLLIGTDYEKRYSVDNSLFLLGVNNKTNLTLDELYVTSGNGPDTAEAYIISGNYQDIGYFTSDESTSIEFRFYDSKVPLNYDNLNTISEDDEAMYLFLEPDAELPNTRSGTVVKSDPAEKRVYRLSDYIKSNNRSK